MHAHFSFYSFKSAIGWMNLHEKKNKTYGQIKMYGNVIASTTEWSRSALRVILIVFCGVADASTEIVHTLMFILVHRLP